MCGIVAGIAQRNVIPILLEGLKRLEYRGYDSAGIVCIDPAHKHFNFYKEAGGIDIVASAFRGRGRQDRFYTGKSGYI